MIEIFSEDRKRLTALSLPEDEVCIWSCIEGIMGRSWINDIEHPTYGIVAVADFLFLLGCAPIEVNSELKDLIETFGRNQIIVCGQPSWEKVIIKEFPDNHIPFKRYSFYWEPERFDQKQLQNYAQAEEPSVEVMPFTLATAEKALENNFTADYCMFFESPEAFMRQGIGYCIIKDQEIIAGASSYSACCGAIDITIGTDIAYRRQGLALKCASKLILACLEKGIYPRWDAANLESVELAKKLGYRFKNEYQVYTIKEGGLGDI